MKQADPPTRMMYALTFAFVAACLWFLFVRDPARPELVALDLELAGVQSEPTHRVDPLWWFRVDERMCFNCTEACDRSARLVCDMDTRCLRAHDYACELACASCRRFLATRSALDLACEVWPGDVCDYGEIL